MESVAARTAALMAQTHHPAPGSSGTAAASLVLGALFFGGCLSGLPAILLGYRALSEINRSKGRLRGKGMAIAGIVAIPGMTSGQLLAGADVGEAIRYQILLYLAIASTVAISVLILLAIRLRRYFTTSHQLRRETLESP